MQWATILTRPHYIEVFARRFRRYHDGFLPKLIVVFGVFLALRFSLGISYLVEVIK